MQLKSIILVTILLGAHSFSQPAIVARIDQHFSLTEAQASHFAALALKCVQKEYPNKPDHTINNESDLRNPRAMHPAFYGCLDWHSTVHGHWMLVHLLRLFPNLPESKQIRAALDANLSAKNITGEVA